MKRALKTIASLILSFAVGLEAVPEFTANAAKAYNEVMYPAEQQELSVPSALKDGEKYFFIREGMFTASEKSHDKMYIPIQRTNSEEEADVTLKVVDLTAHHDVNYTIETYKENIEPDIIYDDVSIVDLIQDADETQNFELADENTVGAIMQETDGAVIVDNKGNEVAKVTSTPLDENGKPIVDENAEEDEETTDKKEEDSSDSVVTPSAVSSHTTGVASLRAARNAQTGTASDRQEIDTGLSKNSGASNSSSAEDEADYNDADMIANDYPGKEFSFHFDEGEEAKYIVITPKYSEASDGDSTILLMLKNPSDGYTIPNDFNNRPVVITDEDEQEDIVISMKESTVIAEDGKAVIHITRQGGINRTATVIIQSWDGSAKKKDEYSQINAKVYFPMGVKERIVEIPVWHGDTEKDFNVTISPEENEIIGASTTRVVLPTAQSEKERFVRENGNSIQLMSDESLELMAEEKDLGQPWQLYERFFDNGGGYSSAGRPTDSYPYGDYFMSTSRDCDGNDRHAKSWIEMRCSDGYQNRGYAYDGFSVNYNLHTNWANGLFGVYTTDDAGKTKTLYSRKLGDVGTADGQWADCYYGQPQNPDKAQLLIHNYSNRFAYFRDCQVLGRVVGVYPIKRTFKIMLDKADPLVFEGMTEDEVMSKYEGAILQDSLQTELDVKTGENFSVSASSTTEYAKMTKLIAYSGNETLELGVSDGKTRTITAELTEEIIDKLANKGMISWSSADKQGKVTGTIHVKPVFDYYKEVEVKADNDDYGTLTYNGGKTLKGTQTFHYGDRLVFEMPAQTAPGMRATGVEYKAYNGSRANNLSIDHIYYFTNQRLNNEVVLAYDYNDFTQKYTEDNNMVRVKVANDDLQSFDTEKGLFKGVTGSPIGDYTYYVVSPNVVTGEFVELDVVTKDMANNIPVWTIPGDAETYSGRSLYFYALNSSAKNEITLSVNGDISNHAKYDLTGTVTSATFNLKTGHNADDIYPVEGAGVNADLSAGATNDEGGFKISDLNLVGNTTLRYIVHYNGNVELRNIKLSPASAANGGNIPATAGNILMNSFTQDGVHISDMKVNLEGFNTDIVDIVEMNGKKLTVNLNIDNNKRYVGYDDDGNAIEKTETVKDICVYFQNTITGEVHGEWYISANSKEFKWDEGSNTATLTIDKFAPDTPEIFTYGDVLMAQIWTDKNYGINSWTGDMMQYAPVSTGYSVITMPGYEPPVFDYNVPDFAEVFQINNDKVDADGMPTEVDGEAYQSNVDMHNNDIELMSDNNNDDTRYTFGQFPYMGKVSAGFNFLCKMSTTKWTKEGAMIMNKLSVMEEDHYQAAEDELGSGNYLSRRVKWDLFFVTEETPWKGVRFMFGVVFSYGNGFAGGEGMTYRRMTNPFDAMANQRMHLAQVFSRIFDSEAGGGGSYKGIKLINNKPEFREGVSKYQALCAFGGPHFMIGVYAGIYLDFGYVEITKKVDGTEKTEISHEMVFMGAGGFLGATGSIEFSVPIAIGYVNIDGTVDVSIYPGSEADPNKTIDTIKNSGGQTLKGQDFGFNFEFKGSVSAGLTLGFGIYRVVGLRGRGGLTFEFGYGRKMAKWFPDVGTNWGYELDYTVSGTLDLVVTNLELFQFSWPSGVEGGWMSYFTRVRQGNLLITFINLGINKGNGTPEARQYCREKADELAELIDSGKGDKNSLLALIKPLKDYAFHNNIISWTQWSRVNMNKQAGLIGSMLNARDTENWGAMGDVIDMFSADDDGKIYSENEMDKAFSDSENIVKKLHVNDHVNSKWVADKNVGLYAAYGPVNTETLMDDAIENPSSEIISLGNNNFLMVFLGDDTTRDRQMRSALMWTVYNASTDTWTTPQKLQDDGTADGKVHLCDAGDKIIVSWTSIPESKYAELREDVAAELKAANGEEPNEDEIQYELEANPSRVLMNMDVFSAEFDKSSHNFGNIEQLTDDEYYDNYPQAVYDERTGDYIVVYTKTAQESRNYESEEDKIKDLADLSPDPNNTYSVLCYMLYNNRENIEDINGEVRGKGWARDYYFANETARTDPEQQADDLKIWKGQRFLQTTLKTDNGDTISDPAIGDMTTANGFNGFAAMAYTVDMDLNGNTQEDKDLYVKYYKFDDHSSYVALRVAGDVTDGGITSQVSVAQPKLIRNDGSTWLFWHESGNTLKYINISDMLTKQVLVSKNADPEDDNSWTYALQADGTFATDPETGETYEPEARTVEFSSEFNDGNVSFSEYRVISDKDDNLYVIWVDTAEYARNVDGVIAKDYAKEIYASAMVKEDKENTFIDGDGRTNSVGSQSAKWSRPYRLTRENNNNDGIAVALDDNGGLVIVHNEYKDIVCTSADEVKKLVNEGKAGIAKTESGDYYIMGTMTYPSSFKMKLTRFDEVGSLEATGFEFSHSAPVVGENIAVAAYIENTGTSSAYGIDANFYEYKDGKRGKLLYSYKNDDMFPVNTSAEIDFLWQVPEDGIEGYQIQADVKEKDRDGNYHDSILSYSDKFTAQPGYTLNIDKCEQNGDVFDIVYSVTNSGNAAYEEGTVADLNLVGLYGDIEEKYGIDDSLLISEDVSGLKPGETRTIEKSISLPVSVFRFCGYDAVKASIVSAKGEILYNSDEKFITLEKPINLELFGGTDTQINAGQTVASDLTYDSTVFIDVSGKTIYTVADPNIASVDENGNVTGLSNGTTTLTATVMPSGVSETAVITVVGAENNNNNNNSNNNGSNNGRSGSRSSGGSGSTGRIVNSRVSVENDANGTISVSDTNPATNDEVILTVTPNENYEVAKIIVTDSNGNEITVTKNDDGTYSFIQPSGNVKVKAEYAKIEGTDISDTSTDNDGWWFKDVPETVWYYDPIKEAYDKKRMYGMSKDYFEPNTSITRGMFVYAVYNREGLPETTEENKFDDVAKGSYYEKAVAWATANGIVAGYDDRHYGPNDPITREQMAAILWRYAKFKDHDVSVSEETNGLSFKDADRISAYAIPSVQWAVKDGIITGFEDNTMRPKENANRAQMAVIFNKIAYLFD
ncbi:MAG TPA: hypothetical protein DCG28_02190 [Lachnospiraceae bacterium]|nr:hypothetical protein [Lachnospiraceae bacterium]